MEKKHHPNRLAWPSERQQHNNKKPESNLRAKIPSCISPLPTPNLSPQSVLSRGGWIWIWRNVPGGWVSTHEQALEAGLIVVIAGFRYGTSRRSPFIGVSRSATSTGTNGHKAYPSRQRTSTNSEMGANVNGDEKIGSIIWTFGEMLAVGNFGWFPA